MQKLLFSLALVVGMPLLAQQSYPNGHSSSWQSTIGMLSVPSTLTTLSSSTTYLTAIHLSDPSATSAIVSIYDGTGAIIYSIPLGGGQPTIFDLAFAQYGLSFYGGISWRSNVPNVVMGNISGAN